MRLELHAGKLARAVLRGEGSGNTDLLTRHRAPDAATGAAGSASFYAVEDRRYGWSRRCLSTNCAQSVGPMRHSFRLLQELLGVSVVAAIREAASRWPEAAAAVVDGAHGKDEDDQSTAGKEIADGDGG